MPTELPLACTLTATEMSARLAEMSAIGGAALLGAVTAGPRATLRFRGGRDTRARLTAVVAAEAECCAFLNMTLRDGPDAVELIIDAPTGAVLVLDELLAAFRGKPRAA